ncbi:hypothetical protein F5X97DRAFT_173380 [Nemania serpens]|nr:hypothetical protein F5X97DRAFT_173380 [Nemania serpens]
MSAKTSSSASSNASDDDNHNESTNATLASKARASGHDLLAFGQRQVDRVLSPATRQKTIDSTTALASERPLLALFLVAQVLFSLLPLVLFATFVLSTAIFAMLFALAFVLFWTGVALVVFVPTLFVTGGLAVFLWLWAMSVFILLRLVYNRLPASLRGTDKHVIIRKDETPAQPDPKRSPTHDFDSDDAIDVEATEIQE